MRGYHVNWIPKKKKKPLWGEALAENRRKRRWSYKPKSKQVLRGQCGPAWLWQAFLHRLPPGAHEKYRDRSGDQREPPLVTMEAEYGVEGKNKALPASPDSSFMRNKSRPSHLQTTGKSSLSTGRNRSKLPLPLGRGRKQSCPRTQVDILCCCGKGRGKTPLLLDLDRKQSWTRILY